MRDGARDGRWRRPSAGAGVAYFLLLDQRVRRLHHLVEGIQQENLGVAAVEWLSAGSVGVERPRVGNLVLGAR